MIKLEFQHHDDVNGNFFVIEFTTPHGSEFSDTFEYGGECSFYPDREAAYDAAENYYNGVRKGMALLRKSIEFDAPHLGLGTRRRLRNAG